MQRDRRTRKILNQAVERIIKQRTLKDKPLPLVEELAEVVRRALEDDPCLEVASKEAG
jgi:hypothetical protein